MLEYSFAFWQWGYVPVQKIPGRTARPRQVIEHMNRVAGFGDDLQHVEITYNTRLSQDVQKYLTQEANNFIYIYGEYDTWSANTVTCTGVTNSKIFTKEEGSHRTRINNMPESQRQEVYRTLYQFLQ